jgi:tetratricopeptide (TPR) repeat protein
VVEIEPLWATSLSDPAIICCFWADCKSAEDCKVRRMPVISSQQLDDAVRFFTAALAIRPRNLPTLFFLGQAFVRQGRPVEAINVYRQTVQLNSADEGLNAMLCNNLACGLATCADLKHRDARQSLELATRSLQLAPENGTFWNTRGAIHFRLANWGAALSDLETSMQLRQGGDALDWFFLAIVHWRLNRRDEARRWYDQAVEWMEQHRSNDDELRRFRAEAAELLGLPLQDKK